jgi:hypothetical protein
MRLKLLSHLSIDGILIEGFAMSSHNDSVCYLMAENGNMKRLLLEITKDFEI